MISVMKDLRALLTICDLMVDNARPSLYAPINGEKKDAESLASCIPS